ncbi:MAG TPA: hypothetical protein PK185_07725 [Cyclobacteriaceae bacterium]|nr:hypothetical protein [Cyclobacteriaceae bacterium]
MNSPKLLIIFISQILLGCRQSHEYTVRDFLESKSIHYEKNVNNAVIVIPLDGCSGCIDKSIEFVNENMPKFKNLYCIVVTPSEKLARLRLGSSVNYPRLLIDIEMTTRMKYLVESMPLIYTMNNELITKYPLDATNIEEELLRLKGKLTLWQNR